MSSPSARVANSVRFGNDFELDCGACQLRRSGRLLKLERIPMDVLLFLVQERGQLVTRKQIVEKIWGNNVYLDTDNSINGAIRKIRQVLKDNPEQPRFIQTLSGRGYRFIASVVEEEPRTGAPGAAPAMPAQEEQLAAGICARRFLQRRPIFIAIAVAMIVVAAGWLLWSRSPIRQGASGTRFMLAVLPFQNLTGDAGQEYFSDGLTEQMITQLGNLDPQHMGVIARTSVMHYKNSPRPVDKISRELGVQYVIEGSVRRNSDKVRITAQLIQANDQTHLWARQYDRDLKDLLALQAEIAQEIADEIQLTLGEQRHAQAAGSRLTPNSYQAYDLYLKGRYFWNRRTPEGFKDAIKYFQQAIAQDRDYALAYAGLADCYTLLPGYSEIPQTELLPKARSAAVKALQLDEGLAEAHTSLALITENYDWDWQTAEKEYRRAIELNPNYATAHQ